jgi:hypothetical protein
MRGVGERMEYNLEDADREESVDLLMPVRRGPEVSGVTFDDTTPS